MKKRVLFGFVAIFLLVIFSSSALAFVPSYRMGSCSAQEVGQQRVIAYENSCGSALSECKLVKSGAWTQGGYFWLAISCSAPSNGTCCASDCGYADYSKSCGSCANCGFKGACDAFLPESTLCQENLTNGFCSASGSCTLDKMGSPIYTNNQENIYISKIQFENSSFFSENVVLDVDFFDDLRLREYKVRVCDEESYKFFANRSEYFPAPVIIGNCAEEIFPLSGAIVQQDLKLSREMWDWILEKIANQGKMSVSFDVSDFVGNVNLTGPLFFIINDFTKPSVTISHEIVDVPGGKEVRLKAIAEDSFDEIKTSIFVDGEKIGECESSPCEARRVYTSGSHNYYAFSIDPSGNNATSSTGTFSFAEEEPTCSDLFGQVCSGEDTCSQETFSASDTDLCCPGECVGPVVQVLSCQEQEGTAFNPATNTCNGEEAVASGLSGSLRCCIGTVEKIPDVDRLEVYWADASGNKIASSALGSEVRCFGAGTLVSDAEFTIYKEEAVLNKKTALPASVSLKVDEQGKYLCEVEVGGSKKSAELNVVEVPVQPRTSTVLPVFGIFNIVAVLGVIILYYLLTDLRKKREKYG